MTSGNMDAGLAVACAVLGHPLIVVMSAGNSPARAEMLRGLGATVELVEQVDGSPGMVTGANIAAATRRARELADERGGCYVDQFHAAEGIAAHPITGEEVLRAVNGPINAWIACVGSGSTFLGVKEKLKAADPTTLCVAVEPAGARALAGEPIGVGSG